MSKPSSGHFEGLNALITKEKLAASGMVDLARSQRAALSGFAELGAGFRSLGASVQAAASSARAAAAASQTQSPSAGNSSPSDTSGGSSFAGAAQDATAIGQAFSASLAPLENFASRMQVSFERVGGTIVTLARRIDSHMKFSASKAALDQLQEKLKQLAAQGAPTSGAFLQIRQAIAANAASANQAIGAMRGLARAQSALRSFFQGDVAGKGLSQVAHMNFGTSIAGAGALRTGIGAMVAPLNLVKSAVLALGVEFAIALGAINLVQKAVSSLADFLESSVIGASALNETLSRAKVIFGSSSSAIVAEADKMAAKFGTVKQEFVSAAAGFGSVFKGAGKSQAEAAALGNQLTKLGMDLASFETTSNADAFAAISSALRGEMDPIEKFHIFLTADKVAAEALALGLAKTKGEISDMAKKMAVLSLITKQSGDANGDLARTSLEQANQWKKMSGTITNMAASVGEALAPLTTVVTRFATAVTSKLARSFEAIKPEVMALAESAIPLFNEGMTLAASVIDAISISLKWGKIQWLEISEAILFAGYAAAKVSDATLGTDLASNLFGGMAQIEARIVSLRKSLNESLAGSSLGERTKKLFADLAAQAGSVGNALKSSAAGGMESMSAASAKLTEKVSELTKSLRLQAETFGMTSGEAEIYKLAQEGADLGSLAEAASLTTQIKQLEDAKKAQDDLANSAKSVIEKTRTPYEKYAAEVEKLQELLGKGLIDQSTFDRGVVGAKKEIGDNGDKGAQFAGLAEAGSKEAYSAIIRHQFGSRDDGMKTVAREAPRQTELLKGILNAAKSWVPMGGLELDVLSM